MINHENSRWKYIIRSLNAPLIAFKIFFGALHECAEFERTLYFSSLSIIYRHNSCPQRRKYHRNNIGKKSVGVQIIIASAKRDKTQIYFADI